MAEVKLLDWGAQKHCAMEIPDTCFYQCLTVSSLPPTFICLTHRNFHHPEYWFMDLEQWTEINPHL